MLRRRLLVLAVVAIAGGVTLSHVWQSSLPGEDEAAAAEEAENRPASVAEAPAHRKAAVSVRRSVLLGRSVLGRDVTAVELGALRAAMRILVVGCIHGDEPAGITVARQLESQPIPSGVQLWVLPDLNPDGVAAGTRENGRGVDLNRNFPYWWRPIGSPGSRYYGGPRALSEPEARMASALIQHIRPAITLWFHQPLGLVDASGGRVLVERRYARLVGLPLHKLPRYPGSAATWANHRFPGTTSFVVELPPGPLSAPATRRYAAAVVALARAASRGSFPERTAGES